MSRDTIVWLLIGVLCSILAWHPFHEDETEITPFLLLPDQKVLIKWYIVDTSNWLSRFVYMTIIHSLMGIAYPSQVKFWIFKTNSFLTLPFVLFTLYMYIAYVLSETDVTIHGLIAGITLFAIIGMYFKRIWR